jgi:hypothetical protein
MNNGAKKMSATFGDDNGDDYGSKTRMRRIVESYEKAIGDRDLSSIFAADLLPMIHADVPDASPIEIAMALRLRAKDYRQEADELKATLAKLNASMPPAELGGGTIPLGATTERDAKEKEFLTATQAFKADWEALGPDRAANVAKYEGVLLKYIRVAVAYADAIERDHDRAPN